MYFHCVLTIHESTACPHKLKPYIQQSFCNSHKKRFFLYKLPVFSGSFNKKDINIDSVLLCTHKY